MPMDNLSFLVLATLYSKNTAVSRYEILKETNLLVSIVEQPYSPGTIYHSIKKLSSKRLIEINQENMIKINQTGKDQALETLLHAPIPSNFVNLFYFVASLELINDVPTVNSAKKRVLLNMIDFNHNTTLTNSPKLEKNSKALIFFRKKLSECLLQLVHNIGE